MGRGTSPVSFDTRQFQSSLARIFQETEKQREKIEKPELEFYEVLKNPVRTTGPTSKGEGEILPSSVRLLQPGTGEDKNQLSIKKSLKGKTFNSKNMIAKDGREGRDADLSLKKSGESAPAQPKKNEIKVEKNLKEEKPLKAEKTLENDLGKGNENGEYTIQVGSFRNLNDALSEIKRLKAKGISSYRTMGRVGKDIWHRVRTGSFKDMASAEKGLKDLRQDGIKGMILTKKE